MEQLDIWGLIQNGDFEQALRKADFEYAVTRDEFPLRNKVYALFHLKKFEEAVLLNEQLIEIRKGESQHDFIFCGIANWILGRKSEAVLIWQRSEQCIYKDAAGGMDLEIILYFAAIKIGDDGLKKRAIKGIKRLLKSKRSTNWPGPLGHYILGDLEEDKLLSYVSSIPILKERQLCQAHFAIATKKLEKGELEGYQRSLVDCISYGPSSYLEQLFYLAKHDFEVMPGVEEKR
jgi:hypothetical protein